MQIQHDSTHSSACIAKKTSGGRIDPLPVQGLSICLIYHFAKAVQITGGKITFRFLFGRPEEMKFYRCRRISSSATHSPKPISLSTSYLAFCTDSVSCLLFQGGLETPMANPPPPVSLFNYSNRRRFSNIASDIHLKR